ncbi:hypothetical protein D3C72_2387330 [compost metagenome]
MIVVYAVDEIAPLDTVKTVDLIKAPFGICVAHVRYGALEVAYVSPYKRLNSAV